MKNSAPRASETDANVRVLWCQRLRSSGFDIMRHSKFQRVPQVLRSGARSACHLLLQGIGSDERRLIPPRVAPPPTAPAKAGATWIRGLEVQPLNIIPRRT